MQSCCSSIVCVLSSAGLWSVAHLCILLANLTDFSAESQNHRITESLRLENTLKITKSNHQCTTIMFSPNHVLKCLICTFFWALPGMVLPFPSTRLLPSSKSWGADSAFCLAACPVAWEVMFWNAHLGESDMYRDENFLWPNWKNKALNLLVFFSKR